MNENEPRTDLPDPGLPPVPTGNGEPHNPDVRHERTDVNTRSVLWFAAALAASIVVVMVILWVQFRALHSAELREKRPQFLLAAKADTVPPAPRLEGVGLTGAPEHSVGRHKPGAAAVQIRQEEQTLQTYGWVEAGKVARIPIAEAMKRLAESGKLPSRKGDKAGAGREKNEGQK
jgi:hypothetical protein